MNTHFKRHTDLSSIAPVRTAIFILLAFLLVTAGLNTRALAAAGDLDATFGTGGTVVTNLLDEFDFGRSVAIQPDGKIVVGGVANADAELFDRAAIVRYLPNGNLDLTFGTGGMVIDELAYIADMALQSDGKIVLVGKTTQDAASDFVVRRYNSDGSLDATFGTAGVVTTDFASLFDSATAVALQADGKIVVVGMTDLPGAFSDFAVVRYLPDGSLDSTFGTGGKVSTDLSSNHDEAHEVAIQPDGKIVVVGQALNGNFGIARYETNGDLDLTFGTGGVTMTDFNGAHDEAAGVGILSDGRIVVGGLARKSDNLEGDFALACYTTTGQLDPGFGIGGKVTTDFMASTDRINDLVIQPDNKIVAVGLMFDLSQSETDLDYAIARYNPDGTLDGAFGIGGKVTTEFGGSETAQGVALQTDCKIVVAGVFNAINTSDSMFALARYDGGSCSAAAACPKPQGYWKNNPSLWPVQSLALGTQTYTKSQLLALLNNSTKTDASIILAKQLIAAKLNVENGSATSPVASAIADADAVLSGFSGKLPYKVKSSSTSGQTMVTIAGVMDSYNNGVLTPACSP